MLHFALCVHKIFIIHNFCCRYRLKIHNGLRQMKTSISLPDHAKAWITPATANKHDNRAFMWNRFTKLIHTWSFCFPKFTIHFCRQLIFAGMANQVKSSGLAHFASADESSGNKTTMVNRRQLLNNLITWQEGQKLSKMTP